MGTVQLESVVVATLLNVNTIQEEGLLNDCRVEESVFIVMEIDGLCGDTQMMGVFATGELAKRRKAVLEAKEQLRVAKFLEMYPTEVSSDCEFCYYIVEHKLIR